jgi:hypothetical protein
VLISEAVAVTPVKSVGAIEISAEPLKDCPAMFLGVCRVVAVLALPVNGAVTDAKVTEADVATLCPMATVGVAVSPLLLVSVTPVPATSEAT